MPTLAHLSTSLALHIGVDLCITLCLSFYLSFCRSHQEPLKIPLPRFPIFASSNGLGEITSMSFIPEHISVKEVLMDF